MVQKYLLLFMLISSIMSIREFLGREDNTRRVPATIEAGVREGFINHLNSRL